MSSINYESSKKGPLYTFYLLWNNLERCVAGFLLFILVIACLLQVLFRFVINAPLDWTEELACYAFILLVYVGASIGIVENRHARAEVIDMILPPKGLWILNIIIYFIWGVFNIVISVSGYEIASQSLEYGETSPVMQIQMGYVYMIIPVMFFVMAIRMFVKAVTTIKKGV